MVESHLQDWRLEDLDILFIENVGNLVCPSSFDLGEQLRVVLLSVTEGEDKPLKYPPIFASAHLALVTKFDLAEPCEYQAELARQNLEAVHPGLKTLETSARSGYGLELWYDHIESHLPGAQSRAL